MDVDGVSRTLSLLREYDPEFEIFGAGKHRYRLLPTATEADVAAFEALIGVALPPDYRTFITQLGDGGAGPYYGLLPLRPRAEPENDFGFAREPYDEPRPRLSRPFQFTQEWDPADDDDEWDRVVPPGCNVYDGLVVVADQGCNYWSHLIVNGPAAGQIWGDYTSVGEGLCPEAESFGAWYQDWLEVSLREALFKRVESTVRDETGWTVDERLLSAMPPLLPTGDDLEPGVRVLRLLRPAYLALYERRHDDARRILTRAREVPLGDEFGVHAELAVAEAVLLREEGRLDRALAAVENALLRGAWPDVEALLRRLQVELRLMQGRLDEARAAVEEHVARSRYDDFAYVRRALLVVFADGAAAAEETLRSDARTHRWTREPDPASALLRRRARRLAWECRRWGRPADAERFDAIAAAG